MSSAASRLKKIIQAISGKLIIYSEEEASYKTNPAKWSKKEVLGHLIDSAANNHQRFVRMQIDKHLSLPQYQQNEWVSIQKYQDKKWEDIVSLWTAYNSHIVHILQNIDQSTLKNTANFPEYGDKTLKWLIDDYIDHLEHHLKQILD